LTLLQFFGSFIVFLVKFGTLVGGVPPVQGKLVGGVGLGGVTVSAF
jgi:hypothetical protein